MNRFFLIILALGCQLAVGQSFLPDERGAEWALAGLQDEKSYPVLQVDFLQHGGVADGNTANDEAFAKLLGQIGDVPTEIYFPEGTYLFEKPVGLTDGLVLKGESADNTNLMFRLEKEDHLIRITGRATRDTAHVTKDISKGTNTLVLEDFHQLKAGSFIKLLEEDAPMVTSSWAVHSTGQILQVDSVSGPAIYIKSPLRRSYSLSNKPRVVSLIPVQHTGIENLSIENLSPASQQTSNLQFQYAANCWVRCIKSSFCNFAHVELSNSTNIEVTGSFFQEAFDFGGGGKAYGVMAHFTTGECLVTHNIFQKLRHAMILQAGANGNVFAYNYSTEPFWTDVSLPANASGDLVLHGNYPYNNLFEGNTVQNIVLDDSHGKNGPFNTFFRNRAELYGIFMSPGIESPHQNFMGNEIPNTGMFMGLYFLSGGDHFEQANNKRGEYIPAGSNQLEPASLFLEAPPSYYREEGAWPPIGCPNDLNSHLIEAEQRFLDGQLTQCEQAPLSTSVSPVQTEPSLSIYPNPVAHTLRIDSGPAAQASGTILTVLTSEGRQVMEAPATESLNVQHLSPGTYYLVVRMANGTFFTKKWTKGTQ